MNGHAQLGLEPWVLRERGLDLEHLGQTESLLSDKHRQLDDAQKRLAEANTALDQLRRLVAN